MRKKSNVLRGKGGIWSRTERRDGKAIWRAREERIEENNERKCTGWKEVGRRVREDI